MHIEKSHAPRLRCGIDPQRSVIDSSSPLARVVRDRLAVSDPNDAFGILRAEKTHKLGDLVWSGSQSEPNARPRDHCSASRSRGEMHAPCKRFVMTSREAPLKLSKSREIAAVSPAFAMKLVLHVDVQPVLLSLSACACGGCRLRRKPRASQARKRYASCAGQQNVTARSGSGFTSPIGSPPLGSHTPDQYMSGETSLLPIAIPGGMFVHCSPKSEPIGSSAMSFEHAPSSKVRKCAVHALPIGAPHAHGVQPRSSMKPSLSAVTSYTTRRSPLHAAGHSCSP